MGGMEHVHGVDVSWMAHEAPKDKATKRSNHSRTGSKQSINRMPIGTPNFATRAQVPAPTPTPTATTATTPTAADPKLTAEPEAVEEDISTTPNGNVDGHGPASSPRTIPLSRPSFGRSSSADKASGSTNGTPPKRSASWFSSFSSKFSSPASSPSQAAAAPPDPTPTAKVSQNKNGVLAPATRQDGDAPYTPAPPKSTPGNFLGIFRRFSSSAGSLGQGYRGQGTHGLVERRILNVDPNRERCDILELNQGKLRRVAFCVDVEIAPQPRYGDEAASAPVDKAARRRMEKGEGEALKHHKAMEEQKENGVVAATGEAPPKDPIAQGVEASSALPESPVSPSTPPTSPAESSNDSSKKKKEKKKKSEADRKARNEKKRKTAEANGQVPMELYWDESDSSTSTRPETATSTKTTSFPTTNPVRIYRRCCQLRETPILKIITEQLTNASNYSAETGIVDKLDLTGYWMQLADLVTLGDYLAVVPVKEVLLENCSLTDEGLRVVLAGLLAAKRPDPKRRKFANYADHSVQGGVVERLVLKNNKIGPEGWRHVCLFVYMCRSLKRLDLSNINFPSPPPPSDVPMPGEAAVNRSPPQLDIADLLSRSIRHRLSGSSLELLNLGETRPTADQLGKVIDGAIHCRMRMLGLARNDMDEKGLEHVSRFLAAGQCEHLDLGGNSLRGGLELIGKAITGKNRLCALSLADCNLKPSSLGKVLPALAKLQGFRFIDLSHNQDLFKTDPSAVRVLRKYLPKMTGLRKINLVDVAMTSEQAIALAEVLPEVHNLSYVNLLGNTELAKLSDARTEEAQEEACALYASLLAACRVSQSIVRVDIDIPSEKSSEIVKALAKQALAYCLRNMENSSVNVAAAVSSALEEGSDKDNKPSGSPPPYPDVLVHLVGPSDPSAEVDDGNEAPDEDYVIGGTGVVKALACCLKNRGDESQRQSGEFTRGVESGIPTSPSTKLPPGKAKDMSKHLLVSARKIRARVQPALAKARSRQDENMMDLRKLEFLDQTLSGIIKRFEDEFPETKEPSPEDSAAGEATEDLASPFPDDADLAASAVLSDMEEDTTLHIRPSSSSRPGSPFVQTSRNLAAEEAQTLRAGHRFRVGMAASASSPDDEVYSSPGSPLLRMHPSAGERAEQYERMMRSLDEMASDPRHAQMLRELLFDLEDLELEEMVRTKGVVRTFKEERERVARRLREVDPEHWERFRESQEKARANLHLGGEDVVVG